MNLIAFPRRVCTALTACLVLTAFAQSSLAADPKEFSKAENLVFVNPHLANLKGSTQLRYGFVKSGAFEPGFTDEVRMDVSASGKTCCKTNVFQVFNVFFGISWFYFDVFGCKEFAFSFQLFAFS